MCPPLWSFCKIFTFSDELTFLMHYKPVSHINKHGVNLVPVPSDNLGPVPAVVHHQLGPPVQERPLQHHPHEGHGTRVHQADPETPGHHPGQDVIRALYPGPRRDSAYVAIGFTGVSEVKINSKFWGAKFGFNL